MATSEAAAKRLDELRCGWLDPVGASEDELKVRTLTNLYNEMPTCVGGGIVCTSDLEGGAFQLDCGLVDLPRIRGLVERYADLPLGFADAAVVACAERNLGRVLTLDDDFSIVGREVPLTILP